MAESIQIQEVVALLQSRRWAALATLDADGAPACSMVAYALDEAQGELVFFLSRLAVHTRQILAEPRIALVVGEADCATDQPASDPQLLARASLNGLVRPVEGNGAEYPATRSLYLKRLPTAERLFGLGDFQLFRFRPQGVRYVGGFGRALSLRWEQFFP